MDCFSITDDDREILPSREVSAKPLAQHYFLTAKTGYNRVALPVEYFWSSPPGYIDLLPLRTPLLVYFTNGISFRLHSQWPHSLQMRTMFWRRFPTAVLIDETLIP